ncbi:phosphotransferase [Leeuwenhoekiella aequorea]|uniref:Maltose alpha-D-glucosyltransferase/alpha-amylase n=1 Tax=Leeuwenhoekiella aequorea TaxID=283736 RepID=A0A4Q0PBT8_9FLAO|nr:phosphotransferase [Leeuwenhoekiella aequorea]RXG23816.1 maltose alpha-D-glucosyltransferase/alpha-amylase [Leeuwenhoekiella aequorea]
MSNDSYGDGQFEVHYDTDWKNLLEEERFRRELCENILESYILNQRWYGGKASALKYIEIIDDFPIERENDLFYGIVLEVNYKEAFVQNYFLPIAFVTDGSLIGDKYITPIKLNGISGFLVDALLLESFRKQIFEKILEGDKFKYKEVAYRRGRTNDAKGYESSRLMGVEQSNTSIIYNEKYILKIFRRVYVDENPDYEISKYLTMKGIFTNTPKYLGSITLRFSNKNVITLGLLQALVPNQGDAWEYFTNELKGIFDEISKQHPDVHTLKSTRYLEQLELSKIPNNILAWCPKLFFEDVAQIATRTAQMHIALGSERSNTAFTPQAFGNDYTVWLKNRLIYQFENRINLVENNIYKLHGLALELAEELLKNKKIIRKQLLDFDEDKLKSERLRIHGDYHLGQILVQDHDFYIIDFEGEPESTIRDRKVKQPPIKDIAGIFRSFNYAIYATIFNNESEFNYSQEELFKIAEVLYSHIVGVFLHTYINEVQVANLNIGYIKEIEFLLQYCLLEKAVYELGYELNARPTWAIIPLKGISNILNQQNYE